MIAGPARRRRAIIAGVATLAVLGAGSLAVVQAGAAASADRYVTAVATTGGVAQTLAGTGTVAPVTSADASFPASATVTGVFAAPGDEVTTGQTLATIDATALQDAVEEKSLAVAQAEVALEQAEDAETSSAPGSGDAGSTPRASGGNATSGPSTTGPASSDLHAATGALAGAQRDVDDAWTSFVASLAHATAICSAAETTPSTPPESTPTATPEPDTSATPGPSASATPESSTSPTPEASTVGAPEPTPTPTSGVESTESNTSACVTALEGTAPAEAAMITAKAALAQAIDALVGLATDSVAAHQQAASTTSTATTTDTPATSSANGSTSSTASAGARSGGGGSQTVAQAQAALDSARLELITAQRALEGATLVAPLTGTLTTMPWSVGDTATTDQAATVTAGEAVQFTIEVAEGSIGPVQVGQPAVVTSTTGMESPGKVSAIGLLPSSSSGSAVTYPVTIVVQQTGNGLTEGTTASAIVTVGAAEDAVVVPVSAVALTGVSEGTVTVLGSGATPSSARVSLGVRGATHVEITDGLDAGTTVMLADTTQAIPSTTSSARARGGSSLTGGSGAGPGGGLSGPPR